MRTRALASAACVVFVAAWAAVAPGIARADSAAEQTSESSASSSATNDNSVSQSATVTQTGDSGGQSQTIEQSAPTEQTATSRATSTQSPTNVSTGGSSSQTSSSGSSAAAGNSNDTTQSEAQKQSSAEPASTGQSQTSTQKAPVSQKADAGATSTQLSPTNVNVVVRVDSPGNDGPVAQTNQSAANAVSGNTNSVTQGTDQTQTTSGGPNAGQAQSVEQSAPLVQDSQASAASTQVAPLNANIVIRNKSPGETAGVTQTNDSQATAQATNQNAVTQSADQAQTLSGTDADGGQAQTIVQTAPTTQTSNADSVSTQTSPTNAGIWVAIDGSAPAPDGSGAQGILITIWIPTGDPVREQPATQTNTSTATATATNASTVTQTASQTQAGGSGGGSQSGGGQSQTVVQETPTTQTSTATSDGVAVSDELVRGSVVVIAVFGPPGSTDGWTLVPLPRSPADRWMGKAGTTSTKAQSRPHRPESRTPDHRRVPLPQSPEREKASLGAGVDRGGSDGSIALVVLAFVLSAPWWARRQVPSVLRRLMAVVSRLERPG